jgi:hypothetical protein
MKTCKVWVFKCNLYRYAKGLGLGAGADRSWSNLALFIGVCAVVKLVPLVTLPLIRDEGGGHGGGGGVGRVLCDGTDDGGAEEGDSVRLTDVAGDEALLLSSSSSSGGGGGKGVGRKYLMSDDAAHL